MIRYAYNRQVEPPAPFVHVALRRPGGTSSLDDLPAEIDSRDRLSDAGWVVTRRGRHGITSCATSRV